MKSATVALLASVLSVCVGFNVPMPFPSAGYPIGQLGMVLHYTMNERANSSAVLDSARNHDGVLHGTGGEDDWTFSHSVVGKIGRAISFDGTNDYISIPSGISSDFDMYPASISVWVKLDYAGIYKDTTRVLFNWGHEAAIVSFRKQDSSEMDYDVLHCTFGELSRKFRVGTVFQDSGWHHVVFMRTSESMWSIKCYVDMDERLTGAVDITGRVWPRDRFEIGQWDGNYRFLGAMDDFRYYNYIIDSTEIQYLYNDGDGRED